MENKYCFLNIDEHKKLYSMETGKISPFEAGIPLLDISDDTIQEIYYFRWHNYFRHVKETPVGYVITEFLPPVPWAGKYNTINCPAGHHFYEGRWIHNSKYLTDYAKFWVSKDGDPRRYSFWIANSVMEFCRVKGDYELAKEMYEDLKRIYSEWESDHLMENGLFYQIDDRDGMEYSAGGSGNRPTINSYMYADAVVISKIAKMLGKDEEAKIYENKSMVLKEKINTMLWDADAEFFGIRINTCFLRYHKPKTDCAFGMIFVFYGYGAGFDVFVEDIENHSIITVGKCGEFAVLEYCHSA